MTMSIDSYRKYSLERGPPSKPREKTIYSPYAKTSFEFRSLVSPEAPAAYTPNSQQAPAAALAQNLRPSVARNDAIKTEIQAKKFTENRERSSNRLSPVVHVDATQTQPDAAATTAHVTITHRSRDRRRRDQAANESQCSTAQAANRRQRHKISSNTARQLKRRYTTVSQAQSANRRWSNQPSEDSPR